MMEMIGTHSCPLGQLLAITSQLPSMVVAMGVDLAVLVGAFVAAEVVTGALVVVGRTVVTFGLTVVVGALVVVTGGRVGGGHKRAVAEHSSAVHV